MLEEFKALIANYPHLATDIDNIREDEHSNVLYDYIGIMTCAVVNTGAEFGDIADTHPTEIIVRAEQPTTRWFNTLEELVATIAAEVDPEDGWWRLQEASDKV